MSVTVELIEPAGAMLSMFDHSTAVVLPSSFSCGVATSVMAGSCVTLVTDRLIPRGRKIRSAIRSSHDLAATDSATVPAARNMMFWYPYRDRNGQLGSRNRTRLSTSARL